MFVIKSYNHWPEKKKKNRIILCIILLFGRSTGTITQCERFLYRLFYWINCSRTKSNNPFRILFFPFNKPKLVIYHRVLYSSYYKTRKGDSGVTHKFSPRRKITFDSSIFCFVTVRITLESISEATKIIVSVGFLRAPSVMLLTSNSKTSAARFSLSTSLDFSFIIW